MHSSHFSLFFFHTLAAYLNAQIIFFCCPPHWRMALRIHNTWINKHGALSTLQNQPWRPFQKRRNARNVHWSRWLLLHCTSKRFISPLVCLIDHVSSRIRGRDQGCHRGRKLGRRAWNEQLQSGGGLNIRCAGCKNRSGLSGKSFCLPQPTALSYSMWSSLQWYNTTLLAEHL